MNKSNEEMVEFIKNKINKDKYQKHYIEENYNTEQMEKMFRIRTLITKLDTRIEVMEEILGGIL